MKTSGVMVMIMLNFFTSLLQFSIYKNWAEHCFIKLKITLKQGKKVLIGFFSNFTHKCFKYIYNFHALNTQQIALNAYIKYSINSIKYIC